MVRERLLAHGLVQDSYKYALSFGFVALYSTSPCHYEDSPISLDDPASLNRQSLCLSVFRH